MLPSFDYEPGEQEFDDNEPDDIINPEDLEGEGEGEGFEEGNVQTANGDRVVVSGDPNAGYAGKVVEQPREKKVANEERATTPYMTKYERARVLGTRALQIRFVWMIECVERIEADGSLQHECTGSCGFGGRNRPITDCYEGAKSKENPVDCEEIFARRMVSIPAARFGREG